MDIVILGYINWNLDDLFDGIDMKKLQGYNLYNEAIRDINQRLDEWSYDEAFYRYEEIAEEIDISDDEVEELCEYIIKQFKNGSIQIAKFEIDEFDDDRFNSVGIDTRYTLNRTFEEMYKEMTNAI